MSLSREEQRRSYLRRWVLEAPMPGRKSMCDAAAYGTQYLSGLSAVNQDDSSFSRKMRNDLNLAIVMLVAAPRCIEHLAELVDVLKVCRLDAGLRRKVDKAERALRSVIDRRVRP